MTTPFFARTLRDITDVFDQMLASLSTLQSLGSIDIERLDEASLLQEALKGLIENFDVERCSVFLCHNDRLINAAGIDWLQWAEGGTPVDSFGKNQEDFAQVRSLMSLAVQTAEPQICQDTRTDPRFRPFTDEASGAHLGSVISAPIRSGGQTLGVLNLSHPEAGHFNEWHERLVPLYSRFLGQFLIAIRGISRLQEQVGSRTRQLKAVLEQSNSLREDYQQLALIDEATGLYNRRFFLAEGKLAVARAQRHQRSLAVVLLELPAAAGLAAKPTVLGQIGQALFEQIREIDLLARTGDHRLALTVAEIDYSGAMALAERLCNIVGELYRKTVPDAQLSSSRAGVGFWPEKSRPAAGAVGDCEKIFGELIEAAEAQLKDAPGRG